MPARCSGPLKATIDALAITVLSRSKKAASTTADPTGGPGGGRPHTSPLDGRRGLCLPLRPLPYRPCPVADFPAQPAGLAPLGALMTVRRRGGPSVLVACWSVKGGVGTTVIAAALALLMAGKSPAGAVIVDLAGDVPAVL